MPLHLVLCYGIACSMVGRFRTPPQPRSATFSLEEVLVRAEKRGGKHFNPRGNKNSVKFGVEILLFQIWQHCLLQIGHVAWSLVFSASSPPHPAFFSVSLCPSIAQVPPPPLSKLRPCPSYSRWGPIAEHSTVLWPSYSRRRDRINLVPNFNLVPNLVQPHKTWV